MTTRIIAENETYRLHYSSSLGMLCVLTYRLQEKKDGAWITIETIHSESTARQRARECGLAA